MDEIATNLFSYSMSEKADHLYSLLEERDL